MFHISKFSIFPLLLYFFDIFHIPKIIKISLKFYPNQKKNVSNIVALNFKYSWNIPYSKTKLDIVGYSCYVLFLECSWNIQYHKKIKSNILDLLFWKITFISISYSIEYSIPLRSEDYSYHGWEGIEGDRGWNTKRCLKNWFFQNSKYPLFYPAE